MAVVTAMSQETCGSKVVGVLYSPYAFCAAVLIRSSQYIYIPKTYICAGLQATPHPTHLIMALLNPLIDIRGRGWVIPSRVRTAARFRLMGVGDKKCGAHDA